MTLIWIIGATIVNGLMALTGVFSLYIKDKVLNRILLYLVAFSAGALLSGAFIHLIAESLEVLEPQIIFTYLLIGFSLFYLIERFLHWHHCHEGKCEVHPVTYLILWGDSVHNFIDGIVIAASFLVDIKFGIFTTILIISHEFPQELGDFGVLVHSGMNKKKAVFYNFLSQLTAVIGGIIGFYATSSLDFTKYILPFAAGGFIYIAASDLIPELHKEVNLKKSISYFATFSLGILFVILMKLFFSSV